MLITPKEIKSSWGLGGFERVIHVGAHQAEELDLYQELG